MRVQQIASGLVEKAAALSHAAPASTADMLAIQSIGDMRQDVGDVILTEVTGTPITVTGAYLVGYCPATSKIRFLGYLNDGNPITLTAIGYTERVIDVGAFTHLAVVDTGSGGTHTYGYIPLEHT